MPLTVELWNEITQRSAEVLLPEGGFLNHVLPPPEEPVPAAYPLLSAIDRYGWTAFNYIQMDKFIAEWDTLDFSHLTDEQLRQAEHLRSMALRCKDERLLLWFEGD